MNGLLVSVCSGEEAREALAGGTRLIDVKEPSRGSLGAADSAVWRDVQAVVAGRVPTSVALGELYGDALLARMDCLAGFDYAKVGLAGCGASEDWPQTWENLLRQFPTGVTPVAVICADWHAAQAPQPDSVIDHACRLHCGAVLLDTFDKTGGCLTDHLDAEELSRLVGAIRDRNMLTVLGGSLGPGTIADVMHCEPDYVAVRGAVCRGTRTGPIDCKLIRDLAALVDS